MRKHLIPLALIPLILAGCSSADTTASSDTDTGSVSGHEGTKNWEGTDELNTAYIATVNVSAPSGVDEARELMGKSDRPLHFLAVTVDNRQGDQATALSSASFTTPEGDLVEYTYISKFLNYQEAKPDISTDAGNRIIEVHNAFTANEYTVAAGQKKTLILASESSMPAEITRATINNITPLSPTDEVAETDKATGAPEPSEPVGSNDPLADLSGTTLKGNDIRFYIYSPNYQKELNEEMPPALSGAWGALCSISATEDQLNETGALTGDRHVWRSTNYAITESGVAGLGKEADYKVYEAEALIEGGNEKCVLVHTSDTAAAEAITKATIGQYVGTTELVNTVEIK